jgi:putative transposase
MARPLSIDLRERAVAAVLKGGLSRHRAAAQFGVAASTVINWVRRFQETGSVAPARWAVTSQRRLPESTTPF